MPYNFEATFTQPILTKLDKGLVKGADDWADTITKAYIRTIKAGLPVGVPPALPAPSQLGVPYPIGASPYNTADSRSRAMYTVIRAYFTAKELKLNKESIQGLVVDIKQMIRKIREVTKQVRTTVETIKLLEEELKQLPKIIADIEEGIKEEIKARIDDLKDLEFNLSDVRVNLGEANFKSLFQQELDLLDKIKKFDPTNIAGIRDIALFVSEYGKRTNSLLAMTDNNSLLKKYILGKLFGVATVFLELVKGLTNPSKIINFVNQIRTDTGRAQRLYERLKQFDLFVRIVQPKLDRLEAKKKDAILYVNNILKKKLADMRAKLNERIVERSKQAKSSKSAELYTQAKKIITDLKNNYQKLIKKYRGKIKLLQKAAKLSITIIGQVTSLIESLKLEFENIKNEITTEVTTAKNILTIEPAESVKLELSKLEAYLNNYGLIRYANLAALVLVETKCSVQTFKIFFERKRATLRQYNFTLIDINANIVELIKTIQALNKGSETLPGIKVVSADTLSVAKANRKPSLCEMLLKITSKIEPALNKVQADIEANIKQIEDIITTKLTKFTDELKIWAINLVPLKSDVNDPKDRAAEASAKLNIINEKIAKIKKLIRLGVFISKMGKGFLKLSSNLTKGVYKFSENQQAITDVVDNYYNFKMFEQSVSVVKSLTQEKTKTKERFQSLILIEVLVFALIETTKDIKNTDFLKDFTSIITGMSAQAPGKEALMKLKEAFDNPPKTPIEFRDLANSFAYGVLENKSVLTKLVDLERRYLMRSREIIKTLCDINELKGTKYEKVLTKINNTLNKNQSFVLLGLNLLKDEIKRFTFFIKKKIQDFIITIKIQINNFIKKISDDSQKQTQKQVEKKINPDAIAMSFAFGLAARLFWTGAQWVGPTGTTHIALTIGPFKPIKAKASDGASKMIREVARGFQNQLILMNGLAIPPAPTGIPPIPFKGYK